jgi:aryl-alcohol dehydrogenase-like predicted oxidoreductase
MPMNEQELGKLIYILNPYSETLEALHDVVKVGKARYIGASSMHA